MVKELPWTFDTGFFKGYCRGIIGTFRPAGCRNETWHVLSLVILRLKCVNWSVIDGLIYLPEIKYRRVLNKAFGPGAWGLAPRSETNVGPKIVSREYALVCQGRLVAIARGEQEYFDPNGIPTATEACKSNALMRCCKDLGIASELWDPRFIREFKAKYCVELFAEHLPTKKKYV